MDNSRNFWNQWCRNFEMRNFFFLMREKLLLNLKFWIIRIPNFGIFSKYIPQELEGKQISECFKEEYFMFEIFSSLLSFLGLQIWVILIYGCWLGVMRSCLNQFIWWFHLKITKSTFSFSGWKIIVSCSLECYSTLILVFDIFFEGRNGLIHFYAKCVNFFAYF